MKIKILQAIGVLKKKVVTLATPKTLSFDKKRINSFVFLCILLTNSYLCRLETLKGLFELTSKDSLMTSCLSSQKRNTILWGAIISLQTKEVVIAIFHLSLHYELKGKKSMTAVINNKISSWCFLRQHRPFYICWHTSPNINLLPQKNGKPFFMRMILYKSSKITVSFDNRRTTKQQLGNNGHTKKYNNTNRPSTW